LPARDLAETRAFYERIGFETLGWWPDEFGGYAILSRDGLEIHFSRYTRLPPLAEYAQCYWRVDNVDLLYREIRSAGVPEHGTPQATLLEDKPWGMREFVLTDPNGNLIRIGQGISTRANDATDNASS
jgi:catechol 2,3-dioxygenase-like lactoylglutathione lyase family enzyme